QVKALFVKTAEVFGRVDILLNNAGQATSGTILTLDLAHYRRVLELNVFGVLYAMKVAVPYMKERGGVIINVSSMVAFLNIPFISHYASTKYAMSNISHTARIEFKPYDIRVVTLYPGMTATDLYTNVLSNEGAPKMPAMKSDSAEFVARKILKAVRKEPRDMYMSFSYRFQVIFARLFPGFLDNVIGKGAMKQAGSETR
ncbi:MAG: SDR family oxidoreductase, partial [Spirochaetales bacterium]